MKKLATCIPYDSEGLKHAMMAKHGFADRTLLRQLKHLCQCWTRLDIQTAVQRLAQYQNNAPGELHFLVRLHVVKYLRYHPDLPLVFNRKFSTHPIFTVSSIAQAVTWIRDATIIKVEAHDFERPQTFLKGTCDIIENSIIKQEIHK